MRILLVAIVLVLSSSAARGDEPSRPEAKLGGAVDFLNVGEIYRVRFAPGANVFEKKSSSVSRAYFKKADGTTEPSELSTTIVTLYVEAFRVVRLGPESWALLEHPAEPADCPAWNFKYRAAAELANSAAVAKLEETDDGKQRLAKLHELANAEFETAQTWINLHYAISIGDMPEGLPDPAFSSSVKVD